MSLLSMNVFSRSEADIWHSNLPVLRLNVEADFCISRQRDHAPSCRIAALATTQYVRKETRQIEID